MKELRFKIQPAAIQFRCSRETIKRGLAAIGARPDAEGAYLLYDIHRAIAGDKNLEIIKGHRLDNELKEQELAEKKKQMMSTTDVNAVISALFLPIRHKLEAAEQELKGRCNQKDPEHAGKALREWTRQAMRLLQVDLTRVAHEVNEERIQDSIAEAEDGTIGGAP